MIGWTETTTTRLLQDGVIEIGDGYRAKNAEFRTNGGLPFVRVADIGTRIFLQQRDELPLEDAARYGPKISQPHDSLITMKGTVGRVAYVSESDRSFVYSPQISYWRSLDADHVNPRWLRYWLESPEFKTQALATKGATDMADYINLRDQRRMRITLPPPSEQRRIGRVLGALDDLIENSRRRIDVLEQMAQAIYREWFVRFRYPGHEDCALVDSALGPIPEGWEVKTFGSISTNFDRRRKPLGKLTREQRSGSFPYYGAAKLIDWIDGWIFDGEYLLFAEDGTVQTPDGFPVLQLVDRKFWANNHTHILQGRGVSTRFLFLASAGHPIAGYVTGAAQPKITQANLNRISLIVGPPSVQAAFDQAIDPIFDTWNLVEASTAPLQAIRDLLLPRLVSGQIDVSNLDLDAIVGSVA